MADAFLERALQDPATGLPNAPYLELIRDWEERRAQRRGTHVRVLKLAVTGGSERVRRTLSWRLIRALRDSDFIASRGPACFELLLTTPDAEHTDRLRARLAELIADLNASHPEDEPLHAAIEIDYGPADVAPERATPERATSEGATPSLAPSG